VFSVFKSARRFDTKTYIITCTCIALLIFLSACQGDTDPNKVQKNPVGPATATSISTPTLTPTAGTMNMQVPGHRITPTPAPKPSPTTPPVQANGRPVLAFFYPWYNMSTWNANTMSDLPSTKYNSSDDATIQRQVSSAATAGITGFISSWWGAGDQTDKNFAKVLSYSATLEKQTGAHFASTIYFESNAPALQGTAKIVSALQYMSANYTSSPYYFHWQGKPVFFFWAPLANGRTLDQWASIRSQVDPNHQMIWSAEGVDTTMLNVFDGIHLFSGGYWGLQSNTMPAVDQGFRNKVDAYNKANGTNKIWAAGIIPGYDDTHVPGRQGAYSIARNNGATYTTEWQAAMASNPEWITITSFNEWFEGSMIEPSATYGTEYLNLTQQFAKQWHG
jgi:hypothetical protein